MTALWRLAALVEMGIVRRLPLENRYPPLFIVGAPRSGTTLVYLHVVNRFDFAYFPNLSKRHPAACVTAALLARRRHAYRATYRSRFGEASGPLAPSDGWPIFHRWFPRYRLEQPVAVDRLHELRTIVRGVEAVFDGPFVNKNNANSARIDHLSRVFPDAIFLHVRRDIVDASLSLRDAREKHGVAVGEWWSAAPPRYLGHGFADQLDQAVHQVWGVDRRIAESLAALPRRRWMTVRYGSFCKDPGAVLDWVENRYRAGGTVLRRREGSIPDRFSARSRADRSPEEAERVRAIVKRLEQDAPHDRVAP